MEKEVRVIEQKGDYVRLEIDGILQLLHWTQANSLMFSQLPYSRKNREPGQQKAPSEDMIRSSLANPI